MAYVGQPAHLIGLSLALCVACLVGCTSHQAVGLSPSTAPILQPYSMERRVVRAEACVDVWLGFIRVGDAPDTIQVALAKIRGQLARVSVDVRSTFWLLGYTRCVIVAGHRIRRSAPAEAPDATTKPAPGQFKRLTPGQSVAVTLAGGEVVEGIVRAHTREALRLESAQGPVDIETSRIEAIAPSGGP